MAFVDLFLFCGELDAPGDIYRIEVLCQASSLLLAF